MQITARHQCLIYEGAPSDKLSVIATIIQGKLEEGYRCLYLNSTPMIAALHSLLSARGVDVPAAIAKGRLILSDEPVMTNGEFDIDSMLSGLEEAIDEAVRDGFTGLWASGDMTWEFGPNQDFSKLLQYEISLEKLFEKRKELCGICQYHRDSLPDDVVRQGLHVHPGVVVNETLSRVNPYYMKASPTNAYANINVDEVISLLCRPGHGLGKAS